jgi:uncharacterized membrane protein YphA (DoxX/SURF4 family)
MSRFAAWGSPAAGLRVLSVMLGVFLIFMGLDKIGWLTDSGMLTRRLQEWHATAPPLSRWYLETIAIPGAPIFARLVLLGELASGAALVCGVKVRLAAALSLVMVLNFHFASDVLLHYSYLNNAYGPPVLGGLLALAIGGTRLPVSLSK